MIGSGIAVLVILGLILFLTVGKSSSNDASPASAAKALLAAGKSGSVSGVTNAVCSQDRALISSAATTSGNPLVGSDRLTSYSVGAVTQTDATHASVAVSYKTAGSNTPENISLPVEKNGGAWKVCFSSSFFSGGSALPSGLPTSLPSGLLPSGLPTSLPSGLLPSGLPTSLPSGLLPSDLPSAINSIISGVCASASGSAAEVIGVYIGLAESGQTAAAQACTEPGKVSADATAKFASKTYTPVGVSGNSVDLAASDGSKVTITASKESSGYLVTKVSFG
jgi:hypothetical protein